MNRSDGTNIFVLGVTGGIGVGKSTVTNILEKLGAKIIDCDKISKNLSDREDVLKELLNCFGTSIKTRDNKLDRKALSKLVFSDKEKLELLNAIMHKKVVEEIHKRLSLAIPNEIMVIDAPIPVNEGFVDTCDEIWTIIAPDEIRVKRVMIRDNLTESDVFSRINPQIDVNSYIDIADKIINNDGDLMNLYKQIDDNWAILNVNKKGQVD